MSRSCRICREECLQKIAKAAKKDRAHPLLLWSVRYKEIGEAEGNMDFTRRLPWPSNDLKK